MGGCAVVADCFIDSLPYSNELVQVVHTLIRQTHGVFLQGHCPSIVNDFMDFYDVSIRSAYSMIFREVGLIHWVSIIQPRSFLSRSLGIAIVMLFIVRIAVGN